MWYQQTLTLSAKPRGFHLVTDEVIGQIRDLSRIRTGLLHLLLQHTSASLTLNENCDPTVRSDMEQHFLKTVRTTPLMNMTMREQMTCRRISNPLCWAYR